MAIHVDGQQVAERRALSFFRVNATKVSMKTEEYHLLPGVNTVLNQQRLFVSCRAKARPVQD
jgi:hypothetical protein